MCGDQRRTYIIRVALYGHKPLKFNNTQHVCLHYMDYGGQKQHKPKVYNHMYPNIYGH